ncbi:unnamed protein product, partial [Phaeothamnion confervicola]
FQKNYYFDSVDGCLDAAGRSALRIRAEGPALDCLEWEVTLKLGVSQDGAYFQAHEWNAPVDRLLAQSLLKGGEWPDALWHLEPLRHFETSFGRRAFKALGNVDNLRIRCPLFGEQVAEVDMTTFPDGHIDYEIEVETELPDEVSAYLHELAGRVGITLSAQEKTK